MTFRESINNLIRTDRPESPTDLIFIFGSLVLLGLLIYSVQTGKPMPYYDSSLIAMGAYKGVKVVANFSKKGKIDVEPQAVGTGVVEPGIPSDTPAGVPT